MWNFWYFNKNYNLKKKLFAKKQKQYESFKIRPETCNKKIITKILSINYSPFLTVQTQEPVSEAHPHQPFPHPSDYHSSPVSSPHGNMIECRSLSLCWRFLSSCWMGFDFQPVKRRITGVPIPAFPCGSWCWPLCCLGRDKWCDWASCCWRLPSLPSGLVLCGQWTREETGSAPWLTTRELRKPAHSQTKHHSDTRYHSH